ncbi:MAG: hypothetical protein AMXMBFR46_25440 [Acidimicrobiia bacterium]
MGGDPPPAVGVSVLDATRQALDAAGRADTAAGAVAVVLAARLDRGGDTAAATATLAREHRAALADALRVSPLDDLMCRGSWTTDERKER